MAFSAPNEEWKLVVHRVKAIPSYLRVARLNLRAGQVVGVIPDRRMVQLDGIAGSQAAIEFFQTDLPTMAQQFLGNRPFASDLHNKLENTGKAAADAYQDFIAFLNDTYNPNDPVDRFAIGAPEYEWRIRNNFQLNLTGRRPLRLWCSAGCVF